MKDPVQHADVVDGIVMLVLANIPVGGERGQAVIWQPEAEPTGQRHRAQAMTDWEQGAGANRLVFEEVMIKASVVSHQDAVVTDRTQIRQYVLENRLTGQPVTGQAMHMDRPRVTTRIQQSRKFSFGSAALVDRQGSHAEHPIGVGAQPRCLDVHKQPPLPPQQGGHHPRRQG